MKLTLGIIGKQYVLLLVNVRAYRKSKITK